MHGCIHVIIFISGGGGGGGGKYVCMFCVYVLVCV